MIQGLAGSAKGYSHQQLSHRLKEKQNKLSINKTAMLVINN